MRALALALLLLATPAGAATISVSVTGTIDFVEGSFPSPPPFAVGDPVSVAFEIDSTTLDSVPDDPTGGRYVGAVSNLSFSFGGYTGTGSGISSVEVFNNYGVNPDDAFDVHFQNAGDGVAVGIVPGFALFLTDTTATVFSSDAIPASLDLADFDGDTVLLSTGVQPSSPFYFTVTATVESLSYTVPEPGTLGLVALVLGAVASRPCRPGVQLSRKRLRR